MEIQCPKCNAVYNIPEKALPKEIPGAKPQKMRCFKCETVFSVVLRQPDRKDVLDETTVPTRKSDHELCVSVFDYNDETTGAAQEKAPVANKATTQENMVLNTSAWNADTTLDLGSFSTERTMPVPRFLKIVTFTVLIIAIAFFAFVASQNKWVLSFPNITEQIRTAFFGAPPEVPTNHTSALKTDTKEGYKLLLKNGSPIIVIKGTIKNTGKQDLERVVLRGRIVDSEGKTLFETKGPCGRVFKDRKLKRQKPGTLNRLFKRKTNFLNCRIKADKTRKFQLVLDNVPGDFTQKYTVKVQPVSAQPQEQK